MTVKSQKKKKKQLASTKPYILRKLKNKCCIKVPKLPLIGNLMENILKGTCPSQEFLSHWEDVWDLVKGKHYQL